MSKIINLLRTLWSKVSNTPIQTLIEEIARVAASLPSFAKFSFLLVVVVEALVGYLAYIGKLATTPVYILLGVLVFVLIVFLVYALIHISGKAETQPPDHEKKAAETLRRKALAYLGANGALSREDLQKGLGKTKDETDTICNDLIAADFAREGFGVIGITDAGRNYLKR